MFPQPTNGLKTGGERRLLTREKKFLSSRNFLVSGKVRIFAKEKNTFSLYSKKSASGNCL